LVFRIDHNKYELKILCFLFIEHKFDLWDEVNVKLSIFGHISSFEKDHVFFHWNQYLSTTAKFRQIIELNSWLCPQPNHRMYKNFFPWYQHYNMRSNSNFVTEKFIFCCFEILKRLTINCFLKIFHSTNSFFYQYDLANKSFFANQRIFVCFFCKFHYLLLKKL